MSDSKLFFGGIALIIAGIIGLGIGMGLEVFSFLIPAGGLAIIIGFLIFLISILSSSPGV